MAAQPLTDTAPSARSLVWPGNLSTHSSRHSPHSLPSWPSNVPGRFPQQIFCTSCSFSVPLLPSVIFTGPITCLFLIVASSPLCVKCASPSTHSVSLLPTTVLFCFPSSFHYLTMYYMLIVCSLLFCIRIYSPWGEALSPFYSLLYSQHIDSCLILSRCSRNSYWANKWMDVLFWRALWK